MSALYPSNPANMARKTKTIDSWSAEAVAAGTHTGSAVEVPRGAQNISFTQEFTVLDVGTGDEDYTLTVEGRDDPNHSWVPIPGLAFTMVDGTAGATSAYQQLPTAANAPGVRVPRYVRGSLLTVGTTAIVTGTLRMHYSAPRGPGKVVDHAAVS